MAIVTKILDCSIEKKARWRGVSENSFAGKIHTAVQGAGEAFRQKKSSAAASGENPRSRPPLNLSDPVLGL